MDIKGSNNIEIGGGEIGGGLNLSKNNDENKFGINVNIGGENKGIDIDTNFNELKNSYQEDKNKENKNSLNKEKGEKKDDGDNINIDLTKTANVGINGQKVGDRIEY